MRVRNQTESDAHVGCVCFFFGVNLQFNSYYFVPLNVCLE